MMAHGISIAAAPLTPALSPAGGEGVGALGTHARHASGLLAPWGGED